MSFTTDPKDERLGHGADEQPRPQQDVYLVLSEEERAKGFVRPLRLSYKHVGKARPKFPLRDLTEDEKTRHASFDYVKFEEYPESESPAIGRFWTQKDLDEVDKGCYNVTTLATPLAETYARDPSFYGSTYCLFCGKHRPVAEFVWLDGSRVGS